MPIFSFMAALALLAPGSTTPGATHAAPLRIEEGWVREAPPGMSVLGAYARFCNDGDAPLVLVDARSASFDAVEMHVTVEDGGAARMKRLDRVELPPHECVGFEPGGRHLMLIGPKDAIRAGDSVQLAFILAGGETHEAVFPVRRGGMASEQHQHHGHH